MWLHLLSCGQQDQKHPKMPRSPLCSRRSCGVWGKDLCHLYPSCLHLKAGLKALTGSGRRENGFGNYLCYWQGKRTVQAFLGSPCWQKDLITQKCFQFQLQVIHLFAQVPINSGQNFLHFSSKACTDLSVGCSRAEQSPCICIPSLCQTGLCKFAQSSSPNPADPDPPHSPCHSALHRELTPSSLEQIPGLDRECLHSCINGSMQIIQTVPSFEL